VQSYRVVEGAHPSLDKLGGTGWNTRKTRVRKSLEDMPTKLLALYAARKRRKAWHFLLTEISSANLKTHSNSRNHRPKRAIADIKKTWKAPRPWTASSAGDVGYGKTEVPCAQLQSCRRLQSKSRSSPHHLLAFQHFETFKRRFSRLSGSLSRCSAAFELPPEQKTILPPPSKQAKFDIVIGTHRLLSKDVRFQDLGLMIVDEEQRFA